MDSFASCGGEQKFANGQRFTGSRGRCECKIALWSNSASLGHWFDHQPRHDEHCSHSGGGQRSHGFEHHRGKTPLDEAQELASQTSELMGILRNGKQS
jgi:hypothetical protein